MLVLVVVLVVAVLLALALVYGGPFGGRVGGGDVIHRRVVIRRPVRRIVEEPVVHRQVVEEPLDGPAYRR